MDHIATDLPEVARPLWMLLHDRARDASSARPVLGDPDAVAADLTGATGWLDAVPTGRPALAVADGLMAVLPGMAFRATVAAVAAHTGSGEIAFNAYSRANLRRGAAAGPALAMPVVEGLDGVDDAREPEGWGAGLRLVEEILVARSPHVLRYPPLWRTVARVVARSDRMSRSGDRILRYAFG